MQLTVDAGHDERSSARQSAQARKKPVPWLTPASLVAFPVVARVARPHPLRISISFELSDRMVMLVLKDEVQVRLLQRIVLRRA